MATSFAAELAEIEARLATVAKERPADLATLQRQYAQRLDRLRAALADANAAPPPPTLPAAPLET